jgi:hypothetical protein
MANWSAIVNEVKAAGSVSDLIRRKYLAQLHRLTGRNVILYYSGWLQRIGNAGDSPMRLMIHDTDMSGFMSVVPGLDRDLGLDLLLQTPGGDMAATETLVVYLRQSFGTDIRVIIPQIAMSAGTVISCAAKEIVMGAHSNLGPFDPQIGPIAAHAVTEEFERAGREMSEDASKAMLWQPILQKYDIGLVTKAERAIEMADIVVRDSLQSGMFAGEPDAEARAEQVVESLGSYAVTKMHARHVDRPKARAIGLKITDLEDDPDLEEAVLSLHFACLVTFELTNAIKIIENHAGTAVVAMAER